MPTTVTMKQAGDRVARVLSSIVGRQANYAARQTVNTLVFNAARFVNKQAIPFVFDRPMKVTMQATKSRKAPGTSTNLRNYVGKVLVDNFEYSNEEIGGRAQQRTTGKAKVPPTSWLKEHIYGGGRTPKGAENQLRRIGVLPAGLFAVPGSGATLDAYGNLPGSTWQMIINYFKLSPQYAGDNEPTSAKHKKFLAGERYPGQKVSKRDKTRPGYSKIPTARRGGKRVFTTRTTLGYTFKKSGQTVGRLFVGGKGRAAGFKPGVYSATGIGGSNVKCILKFVRQPYYRIRFPFHDLVEQHVIANAQGIFDQKYNQAVTSFAQRYLTSPKP